MSDLTQYRNAITVRNAKKGFGGRKILKGINLNVKESLIYALLGPSGCGKTTLLSCIVGVMKLDSGKIDVFGYPPGSKECGIPGRRIGYQPQDISLSEEFSIIETLHFFGNIFGMEGSEVEKQAKFLLNMLDLTHIKKATAIGRLSGGEKRRVSFAVALLHDPELLILDEPTVGCDPLLRVRIWDHLLSLKKTIIITTHHIEDTQKSSIIGLMRNGKLLMEKTPENLMLQYNNMSIEDIVIKFCIDDDKAIASTRRTSKNNKSSLRHLFDKLSYRRRSSQVANGKDDDKFVPFENTSSTMSTRLSSLVRRNFLTIWRQKFFIFFSFVPAISLALFLLVIGRDLSNLNYGYINEDIQDGFNNCSDLPDYPCFLGALGCQYLNYVKQNKHINLIEFDNDEEATAATKLGNIWGYLKFPPNFTDSYIDEYVENKNLSNETFLTKVHIKMDFTTQHVTIFFTKILFEAYAAFAKALSKECTDKDDYKGNLFALDDSVYGSIDTSLSLYSIPTLLIVIGFLTSMALSGLLLIIEKKKGTYGRILVAGVTKLEITISHLISQFSLMLIQVAMMLAILLGIFQFQVQGSYFAFIFLTIIHGIIGLLTGFLLSLVTSEEIGILQGMVAILLQVFILSTLVWPLEGMPVFLQYISLITPQTLAAESIRSIMNRGWGLTHPKVYPGFLMSAAWVVLLSMAIILLNKFKKSA